MKYLDFICPSVLDILSLATFGGASIAARAAKISAKLAAKGAKEGPLPVTEEDQKLLWKQTCSMGFGDILW